MSKYIAQPQFSNNTVKIYSISSGANSSYTLVTTLKPSPAIATLTGSSLGPNSVLMYEDVSTSSPVRSLLIAYVAAGGNGAVFVFDLDGIDLSGGTPSTTLTSTPKAVLNLKDNPIGMAVQPGTGNLYVATDGGADGNATVTIFPKAAAGSWSATALTPFLTFDDIAGGFASIAANLAFDAHGYLWMTSLGTDGTHAFAFLTCFRGIPNSTPVASPYFYFQNGVALTNGVALLGVAAPHLFPFSCPEGLAFDPAGNLWIASNNAESTVQNVNPGGSLLMIRASHLLSLLFPTPPASGTAITIAADPDSFVPYYLNGTAQPGGLFFDGFTLYVNDEGNGTVWRTEVTSDGVAAPLVAATGVTTTNPGNGSMSIFNTSPSQLTIKDWSSSASTQDTGAEPDTLPSGLVAWESPDVGIAASPISGLPAPGQAPAFSSGSTSATMALSGTVAFDSSTRSAWIFVRITNTGASASFGGEVLKVYWAKASTALQWPDPWDGLSLDPSAAGVTFGGFVGAVALASIPAGEGTIVQVQWTNVPEPKSFTGDPEQGHFCLLARIEGNGLYPFGLTHPELWSFASGSTIIGNVLNNRGLGWRNISITEAGAVDPIKIIHRLGVMVANHATSHTVLDLTVQTFARNGRAAAIPAAIHLVAHGVARQRLLEATEGQTRTQLAHLGEGRFRLVQGERSITSLRLKAKESLPFILEIAPHEPLRDFAVRVIQHVSVHGRSEIIGGQTFVIGAVEGFPVRKPHRREHHPDREAPYRA